MFPGCSSHRYFKDVVSITILLIEDDPVGKNMMPLCVKAALIASDFRLVGSEFELVAEALYSL